MLGHRSIYHDGWRAVCPWPGPSFAEAAQPFGSAISADTLSQLDATGWELYHVAEDFAETRNVAADNRARLIALIGTWYAEAGKYNVLPVDGSVLDRAARRASDARRAARPLRLLPRHAVGPELRRAQAPEPSPQHHRRRGDPRAAAPRACCSARAPRPAATRSSCRTASSCSCTTTSRASTSRSNRPAPCPPGSHELRFEFEPTGELNLPEGKGAPARLQLYVDGELVGETDAPYTTPLMFNPGALTCGANPGSPITPDYSGPFPFTGTIHTVTVDVSGELIVDPETEMRVAMARQ